MLKCKKILRVLAIMAMLLAVMAQAASAEEWKDSGGFKFRIEDGCAELSYYYPGSPAVVNIPAEFEGLPVTSIGKRAFLDHGAITNVTIPAGIKTIGTQAFYGCESLTSVVIPEGLTEIYMQTFEKCTGLKSVTLPDGLDSIYTSAFDGCKSLTSVNIPDGVRLIDISAFKDCTSLTEIRLPRSLRNIGVRAFSGCNKIKDVYFEGTELDWDRLMIEEGNDPLLNATIHYGKILPANACGENVTWSFSDGTLTIEGTGYMYNYNFLQTGPNDYMVPPPWQEDYASQIHTVRIGEGVTDIGRNAFQGCSNLTSVNIPSSVEYINAFAFDKCDNLKDVYYNNGQANMLFVMEEGNGPFLSAAKHYGSAGPNAPAGPEPPSAPGAPVPGHVVLSPQNLTVDGNNIACEKYNIDGRNYFKLRDLAQLLSSTGSQFGVGYDAATFTVTITTGEAYVSNGSELAAGVDNSATAQPSAQAIVIDGVKHSELTVYNIGGSNFFQLRELGTVLGFEVDYDQATNTAIVTSTEVIYYTPD